MRERRLIMSSFPLTMILFLFVKNSLSKETPCDLFYKKSHIFPSTPRFHPEDTKEIQSCLSPDLEEEERRQCRFYALVIDGGSTGTRLHVFEFSHDIQNEHSPFKLESETFKEVKPGLSTFVKNPQLAAENVRELILTAKNIVSGELWRHTPIVIKVTAGFRLLPESDAEEILINIEKEVIKSGLLINKEHTVGLLSGVDEGVFGWFTLNFLLQHLERTFKNESKGVGALDLGGGSTQITFLPERVEDILTSNNFNKDFFHKINIFDNELTLFTHSYLGNGLIAARLGVAKLSTPEWMPGNRPVLKCHCLPKTFILDDWDYAGNIWLISAHDDANFENCLEIIKYYIKKVTNIKPVPDEFKSIEIYAFAYFYDRAIQAAIVDFNYDQTGGVAKVEDYRIAAIKACSIPATSIGPEHWMPWQCLDLSYIYALLRYGYNLPDEKEIHIVKKINHMEVSWASGAAFHLLNTYHKELKKIRQKQMEHESLEETFAREKEFLEKKRKQHTTYPQSVFSTVSNYMLDKITHFLKILDLI